MNQIVVERNVPLPSTSGYTYPWAQMKKGDSFFVTKTSDNNVRANARYHGVEVSIRKEGDGLRVWKTA